MPYLAGAAGAVAAAVLAISGWMTLVLAIETVRASGLPDEALPQVALILGGTALAASVAAYVAGIPAALWIEWALRKLSPHAAARLRYVAYLLVGLAGGALAGTAVATTAAETLPMAALGGGAAVAGAATMSMARRSPRIGRRIALAVPAALVVIGLAVPAG